MTLREAKIIFEERKPGYLSDDEQRRYIGLLDATLSGDPDFSGYTEDFSGELLIKEPYTEIYILYLKAQAEAKWNETELYNDTLSQFAALLSEYRRLCVRRGEVSGQNIKYF